MDDLTLNRRGKDRFRADLRVQYFIKNQSMRYQDCGVIDISRTGIALEFPANEELNPDADIFLEITVPGSFDQLTVPGIIKRIQRGGGQNIGGVKFIEILDPMTFSKLIETS
ncbi:PilZ domain-containing protein [Thermodesulfobacteriota bacterium]